MMRKSALDEVENHERWLVSYADFITLLFAFFVVMYSVSQVNEGKYRVMSKSLESAFERSSTRLNPIDLGSPKTTLKDPFETALETQKAPAIQSEDTTPTESEQSSENAVPANNGTLATPLEEIEKAIKLKLDSVIDTGLIAVRRGEKWLEIDMKSALLFQSGSANLNPSAEVLIETLGEIIKTNQQKVRVRGYTDDQQIANEYFASNWELSAARAAHVVRRLQQQGIEPGRMAVEGFGQYWPTASNETALGRAKNRRVVLAISNEVYQEINPLREEMTQAASPNAINSAIGQLSSEKDDAGTVDKAENGYEIIRTPSGGLLIRARKAGEIAQPTNEEQQ